MAIIAIVTLIEIVGFVPDLLRLVTTVTALVMLLVPLTALTVAEVLNLWAYPDLLPRTVRRYLPGAQPELGLWLAVLGASVLVIASAGGAQLLVARVRSLATGAFHAEARSLGVLFLTTGVVLAIFARSSIWFSANSPAGSWNLPGYVIPWLGVGSLFFVGILLVLTCSVLVVRPHAGIGGLLVIIGWLFTITASLFAVPELAMPHVTPPGWIQLRLDEWIGRLHALTGVGLHRIRFPSGTQLSLVLPSGPVLAYLAGVAIGVAGLLTIRAASRSAVVTTARIPTASQLALAAQELPGGHPA